MTKIKIGLLTFLGFILVFGLALILSKTLLGRWFDPVHQESENTEKLIALSATVDSLYKEVHAKDQYVTNIMHLIRGEVMDTTGQRPEEATLEMDRRGIDLYKRGEATQRILDEFETQPSEGSFERLSSGTFTEVYFFPPLQGLVTSSFDPAAEHFGVDIVAAEDEPVKSIAAGSVIFAHWTLETGYNIGVQHSNELISIYKHNSVLLKKVGDLVQAGEIISIIGNTGEQTTGQHLHLELWYKGTPLNPQEFITFD
ncbi:M23 family metallopeptidase [Litoribacter ruber]|uniref:M23 family metallopeptidase n=1 Tax=Litoribacter ruber TaxID=702568 RepID=UPI00293D37C0|nr:MULTISPECIES: M23 family metallopeptidase [Litoribacter]